MRIKVRQSSFLALFALLLAVGPISRAAAPLRLETDSSQPASPPETGVASETQFGQALARTAEELDNADYLRMFTRCLGESGQYEQVEIFGNGLVIWNGESQIQVPQLAIISFVHLVNESGFAEMPASFGGASRNSSTLAEPAQQAPLKILCEVEMEIDGAYKRVEQRNQGEQSEALLSLANELLSRCRRRGARGVRASSLSDGLSKLAVGDLAPPVFRLSFTQRPEILQEARDGFLLQMRGRRAVVRDYRKGEGYGPPKERRMSDLEFRQLATRLSVLDIERLPVNLFGQDYVDVSIELLNHRRSVQARQFAGLEPETHGQLQVDFGALVRAVYEVRRLVDEGESSSREP